MVHNSLTVRRFIVTSTLCSLGACHQTGKANCATPPTPLTGNRCPNDIRPVADPPPPLSEGWRVHPHECFRSEVPGPWSRCLRCVSGLFMLTCLLGILWMWSAPGSPIRPYQPPALTASSPSLPLALPQHFVLITKSLSERTKLVEESWTNWRCQLNIFHNQLPDCYVINAFFYNNIVHYKKYVYIDTFVCRYVVNIK